MRRRELSIADLLLLQAVAVPGPAGPAGPPGPAGAGAGAGTTTRARRTDITLHGDSNTYGFGLSTGNPAGRTYGKVMSNLLNMTQTNFAALSNMIPDVGVTVSGVTTTGGAVTVIMVGTNDMLRVTSALPAQKGVFSDGLRAAVIGMATPEFEKIRGNSTLPPRKTTETGTWAASTVLGLTGRKCTVDGGTQTMVLNGTTVYIAALSLVGDAGTFDVSIDGASKGPFAQDPGGGAVILSTNGVGYCERLLRFSGLGPGDHTVAFTVLNHGTAVYFNWATGNGWVEQGARPVVLLSRLLQQSDGSSAANVAAYNPLIDAVAKDAQDDGYLVVSVDTTGVVGQTASLYFNTHHINDAGHEVVGRLMVQSMPP